MTVSEAIRARRSIRKFKPGVEIPQQQIDALLEAAMMAPSAMNLRPWEFVVVKDKTKFPEIIQIHPYANMLQTASLCIIVCGLERLADSDSGEWFQQDCGAATENILLQALDFGLATCWCGVYPVEQRVHGLRELFEITSTPFGILAIGVPDEAPEARGKLDASKVKYV